MELLWLLVKAKLRKQIRSKKDEQVKIDWIFSGGCNLHF